MVRQSNLSI